MSRLSTIALLVLGCAAVGAQSQSVSSPPPQNPLALGAVPPKIGFDVVSFKVCPPDKEGNGKVDMPPNGDYLAYHCEAVPRLIYFAYNGLVKIPDLEGVDAPWMYDTRYEFTAKVAAEDVLAWQKLDLNERRLLMRGVLARALKLQVSVVDLPEPVYLLKVSKRGARLKPFQEGDQTKIPDGRTQSGHAANWINLVAYFQDFTMAQFAELLGSHLDRHVVDRTGLSGPYTFSVPLAFGGVDPNGHFPTQDDLSTAEGLSALGLQLETAKIPTERLSVDHIERPETN